MKGSELIPIDDYYKDHITDIITISRNAVWWSAVILLKNPKNEESMIRLYRWKIYNGKWTRQSMFSINNEENLNQIIEALSEFKIRF